VWVKDLFIELIQNFVRVHLYAIYQKFECTVSKWSALATTAVESPFIKIKTVKIYFIII
jgi:hypothetical protein